MGLEGPREKNTIDVNVLNLLVVKSIVPRSQKSGSDQGCLLLHANDTRKVLQFQQILVSVAVSEKHCNMHGK